MRLKALAPGLLLAAAAACAVKADYLVSPGLGALPDARVAVLPFENESTDITASDYMRKLAEEGLGRKGYPPLPDAEVDGRLSDIGVSEGGQLAGVTPADVGKAVGADLLCYGDVEDFTFQNLGFIIRKSVRLKLKLVSASTGETLYEGTGSGKDIKVFLNRDEAKAAFVEQLAVKLVQNILKAPLKKEAEAAAGQALGRLPGR